MPRINWLALALLASCAAETDSAAPAPGPSDFASFNNAATGNLPSVPDGGMVNPAPAPSPAPAPTEVEAPPQPAPEPVQAPEPVPEPDPAPMPEEPESDPVVADAATFTEVYQALGSSCNGFACHGSFVASGGLDLGSQSAAYSALLAPAQGNGCAGERVVPGDPDASVFVRRLEGTSCGSRMPSGAPALDASVLQTIRSWVSAGAMDD